MRDKAKLPGIGRVPPATDPETQQFLAAVKTTVETREGVRGPDTLDKVVTRHDLVTLGLITAAQAAALG